MGKKYALLVGCNYPGTNAELRGCINDVIGMKSILTTWYGFTEADMTIMIDTDKAGVQPTGKNIKAKLNELVSTVQDGDLLFFHFSGHGTQIPDPLGDEKDRKDEAICPSDMNVICDDDLRTIFKPLEKKPGVKLTFIADCCHSGSLLDHTEVQISGAKDGQPPPPQVDMGALGAFLSLLGQPEARDFKNRALPFSDLCTMLSNLLGGQQVNATNVRSQLGSVFGGDASAKIQSFMQIAQQLAAGGNLGKTAGAGGAGGGILSLLMSCLAPKPQDGAAAGGHAAPAGNLAEPQLNVVLPPAGAKPPADSQLSDDIGVLITGCQSSETSADACPSGDPSKAHGALSNAIQTILKQHYAQNPNQHITYRNLVIGVRELLAKTGFAQNPCLECSQKNADSPFIAL